MTDHLYLAGGGGSGGVQGVWAVSTEKKNHIGNEACAAGYGNEYDRKNMYKELKGKNISIEPEVSVNENRYRSFSGKL